MRLSRLGTDSSLPPDYQGFRAASELGRSILAAGQPSSCRPTTDRGCKAAIQGAAPHYRIRRRDQGRAVGDESASRNRKFESTPLHRRVQCEPHRRGRLCLSPGGNSGRARSRQAEKESAALVCKTIAIAEVWARSRATPSRQLPIELAREKRIYVTAPSAKSPSPGPPTPLWLSPSSCGRARGNGSVLLFVKFVRSLRCTRGHFVDRCNPAATMW